MKKIYAILFTVLFSVLSFGQNGKSWSKKGTSKKETFYNVQAKFDKYWETKTPAKGQGYNIFKRWEKKVADKVYPSGDMSLLSSNYSNYVEWSTSNKVLNKNSAKSNASNWSSLNGNSVASGYDTGSGRLSFITFDPLDASTFYVGAPDGGLWKTTDGGNNWTTNTDFLSVIGCSGLVIHPTTTSTMYLATGDRADDRRSIGVLKSTDGGASWNPTGLTWTVADNYRITKIVMDPNTPSTMMVATDGGVFRTTDGWATHTLTTGAEAFYDIEFKPGTAVGNSNTVYAASVYNYTEGYIYKSTDNGANWTIASGIPTSDVSRIEMAVSANDEDVVYAIAGNLERGLKGVYKSTDSGSNFSLVYETTASTPNILHANDNPPSAPTEGWNGGQADHDLAIAVSPLDANLVTIGGINQWQSTNGGTSWERITYWLGVKDGFPGSQYPSTETKPYIHADIQYIAYSPHDDTTLYTTCDGGISKGISNGQSAWEDITNNIAVGQQTNIALSATDPNKYFAGLQDIGSIMATSAGMWSVLSGGDGEDGFIDRTDDNIIISSTTNGQFYRTSYGVVSYFPSTNGEWFSPIHQDPIEADWVYLGGRPALYKSTDMLTKPNGDSAPNWTALGTPAAGKNILRFEIAPTNNQVMYAITENKLSKSTDAGVNWTDVTGTLPVGSASLKNLTISNSNSDEVWVVFSGYNASSKVFKTSNGGTSWTDVYSSTLPNLPINTIVHLKNSTQNGVFIGADIGVYYIDDSQSAWTEEATNLPRNAVQDLEVFYTSATSAKLRAATYGRGSWETSINFTTLEVNENTMLASEAPRFHPNPVKQGFVNVKLNNPNSKFDFEIYNNIGQKVSSGTIDRNNTVIDLKNNTSGFYFIKVKNENKVYSQKIIIE
ncbi:T9SS type A sorting domain-containing protein [Algibacter amylolyticus]|uniref:T9SS type A sorting domain-containing protein n=1 Tax=Algibacter amylolyticus TaxID=1608400 RepID=A0A5M7B197_9FLAO|nr:T9SS type A sorting domain-containing protein [Algibacter amylolyticus]KAA5823332.1 T9SS type A sorting domain-containing protein [Algibacter amylolyticus]MBB5267474.1 hypothetical protein [Algibacter amylolyticus]TSJ73820.1 T9SS type A sorting domain-containing protein [Algibacter amylolyticus]